VTGGRLLVWPQATTTAAAVAARLALDGWRVVVVTPDAACTAACDHGPEVAVMDVSGRDAPETLARVLQAWDGHGGHLVCLAGADWPQAAVPETMVALRGVDAAGVAAILAILGERDRAVARLASLTHEMERRVAERTELLARQAEALAGANARLLELDALKSGFMATVTHDLRTPLTSVLGFAKLTRREFLKEFMPFADVSDRLTKKGNRIADNLRIIENEGARLTRLVNDFLDLSKIESGRLDWHDRLVDPGEVVRMAVDAVSGEYEQSERLMLVVDVSATLPRLWVDPDRIMQVLVNLLTNAARYAGEGEVDLAVRALGRERVEFRVTDTGPGIPEAERERIFDKFHQVRRGDTASSEKRGTGLGLAICKQIVERYRGAIRAEAREPRGTAFVVELPVPHPEGTSQSGPENTRQPPQTCFS